MTLRPAALCLLLSPACVFVDLRSSTGEGTIKVSPARVPLAPVGGDFCPALGCCGATDPTPPAPGTQLPREACCGSFSLTMRGRDDLVAMQWTAGAGSVLDVIDDRTGPVALSPTGVDFEVYYRMVGASLPRCGDQPDAPTCETGLPPDDGLLELVFRETPSIDVWVEVELPRPEENE